MNNFRSKFTFPSPMPKWAPGHMVKGMRLMQKELKNVDCVIEVHDARIPFTGRHTDFKHQFSVAKPHLLVLNKMDLADLRYQYPVEKTLVKQGVDRVLFTELSGKENKKSCNFSKILPAVHELMRKSERYNRMDCDHFKIMIVGIPNVGKSSLINRLRNENVKKGKPAQVGPSAGVTRTVMEKIKVYDNPPMYVLDTPGVLEPKLRNKEALMKQALISSMSDEVIGPELIADYLLFWLNQSENFSYVEYYKLPAPCDNITEVLFRIATTEGHMHKLRLGASKELHLRPNMIHAAGNFIKVFRSGSLGRVFLDEVELRKEVSPEDLPNKNFV